MSENTRSGEVFDKSLRVGDHQVVIEDERRRGLVRRSLEVVNSVHRSPDLPQTLRIRVEALPVGHRYGKFAPADGISISRGAPNPELTIVHEFGHAIDWYGFGAGGSYASGGGPFSLQGWQRAAEQSATYHRLSERVEQAERLHAGGSTTGRVPEYVRYLARPEEMFARSYAQWIALRSGSVILQAQLERYQRGEAGFEDVVQWATEDFAPIAAELDEVFGSMGWLR